jgi:hypothetical protein
MNDFIRFFTILLFCSCTFANEQRVDDISIHYNAFSSNYIPKDVAKNYGITRHKNLGIISLSVLKKEKSVIANIFGNGKNTEGQAKELSFKEIKENGMVSYIATFMFSNTEEITFNLEVQPEKQGELIPIRLKQQLFTH